MTIYLKTGGRLKHVLKPNIDDYTRKVETAENLTLKEILLNLDFPIEQVAFAYVEGRFQRLDYKPAAGQVITLQPPVSGG